MPDFDDELKYYQGMDLLPWILKCMQMQNGHMLC